ncbi:DUF934 domain-containing protein [Kozakia baliensis]|uniref:DUF934 domain-containing protein n=1 Tax=Kozakia baliensis TaxID=153496 RepID=UPI00055D72B1|nr:DUF934 domain-containing protein [Kozakia baliensis]AOX19945.1 hypothetical protein A0U90_06200 [Kozakia baliensis]
MKLLELGHRPALRIVAVPFSEWDQSANIQAIELSADQSAKELSPFLATLKLIVLNFPIFRDGRAFSQARALREYEKFQGEIRVQGHILPDQAEFLYRCGVDSVVLPDKANEEPWHRERERFRVAYQISTQNESSFGPGLKRHIN